MNQEHPTTSNIQSILIPNSESAPIGTLTNRANLSYTSEPAVINPYEPALSIEKVQMIAKNDPEFKETSNDAFAAAAFAVEYFVQTLSSESMKLADYRLTDDRRERELTYNDISGLISIKEAYQFLNETVPITKSLRELVGENKVRYSSTDARTMGSEQPQYVSQPVQPVHSAQPTQPTQPQNTQNLNEIIEIDINNESDED